jgi:hypothetical protein
VPGGLGMMWLVHMEKLSFMIDNRRDVMLGLTLRSVLRL